VLLCLVNTPQPLVDLSSLLSFHTCGLFDEALARQASSRYNGHLSFIGTVNMLYERAEDIK